MKRLVAAFATTALLGGILLSTLPAMTGKATAAPLNGVPNPSVETADPGNSLVPLDWFPGSWGNNSANYSWRSTGHAGAHSLGVTLSSFSDGGANWSYAPIAVNGGAQYEFADYYQSNVPTQIDLNYQLKDGSTGYLYLGTPMISDGVWTKFFTVFTMPAGAVSATVVHSIYGNGYLNTDDYTVAPYKPVGFRQPLVTLTFDDGYQSAYTTVRPLLERHDFNATFFVISGLLNSENGPDYLTTAQVKALERDGNEIGSHTVTHANLALDTIPQVDQELSESQTMLQNLIGRPVRDFATPDGASTAAVNAEIMKFYRVSRGIQSGFNSRDNFDPYNILVQDVFGSTTTAQVDNWIAQAKSSRTWLVLVYHDVQAGTVNSDPYDTAPSKLKSELSYLERSGVTVETMAQALQEVRTQTK